MGLVGALFPFGAAIQFSDHNCSFLWNNIRHVLCIIALILYVLGIVLLIIIIGIFFLFAWFIVDIIALILGLVAAIAHILACKDDEGIASAFTSFGLSITAVSCMSLYNTIIHVIAWCLTFVGVGFFIFFVVYFIAIILLIIAFLAAKAEA